LQPSAQRVDSALIGFPLIGIDTIKSGNDSMAGNYSLREF